MSVNYGSKRIVVGAHYGASDWLVQRGSAVVIVVFTAILLAQLLFTQGAVGYAQWAGIFAPQWMKFITAAAIVSVLWHAWIGVRNVWMDYAPGAGIRFLLQTVTVVWIVGCAAWSFQVLWRI
ncbi:MAG: succinate dehydrogenase, hydrophobic membrane anchor protein [Comamonas sp.]|nr:succinate dehydrogenase, hydrophobic membrane anchor protein [Comamonas sp.]